MLSKDLAIYACQRGRATPDRLLRQTHAGYAAYARRLIDLYRGGTGRTREELHRAAEAVFADEPDCPPQRIRALVRLLDQASEYRTDTDGRAMHLRRKVFALAAARHPLVEQPDALFQHCEAEVKREIGDQLGRPWAEIDDDLYSDLPAFHRLTALSPEMSPEGLLRAYNVAQAQLLLFWAEEMTVTAQADFKRIFRHAKLNGLLHEVEPLGGTPARGFRIRLSGPASVLSGTRRYGVSMAAFLPVLLTCREWKMSARLRLPRGIATFTLSPQDQLRSHLTLPDEFDSEVERAFAEKFGEAREGWRLEREGGFLVREQRVFIPDFTFRHEDGTVVYLEIVGFWTPEYLDAKRRTLALFDNQPIIVAVARSVSEGKPALPGRVITYATRLKVKPLLEQLKAIRDGAS